MPKPYDIRLRVEEIALGSVLRRLHEMPGVMDVDLDLGKGGNGSGAEKLAAAAAAKSGTQAERVLRVLANGPLHRTEVARLVGAPPVSVATVLTKLKKDGVLTLFGQGVYGLANGAAPRGPAPLALPAPVAHSPSGRIAQGAGSATLLMLLLPAPLARSEVGRRMSEAGVPNKSVTGILFRADRDKLVKKHGTGPAAMIELTAKGKHAAEATQHG